jgi:hypothetical protein
MPTTVRRVRHRGAGTTPPAPESTYVERGWRVAHQDDPQHRRPEGASDEAVAAAGKVSEALEVIESARGHLFTFHRLTGKADMKLGEAVDLLRSAGSTELADRIERELIGANVLPGRWTFQIVEEYDDGYYALFHELDRAVRDELTGGRRHVYEAEMKEDRRTDGVSRQAQPGRPGQPGHESRPDELPGAAAS